MNRTSSLYTFFRWAVVAFSLVGIVDAAYLSYARFTHSALSCTILDGCNVVAASPHAVLLGVIPLAYLGLVFYIAIFFLGVMLFRYDQRSIRLTLVGATGIGIVASAYFVYVQSVLIGAYCLYCIISAALSVVLFPLALALLRKDSLEHSNDLPVTRPLK